MHNNNNTIGPVAELHTTIHEIKTNYAQELSEDIATYKDSLLKKSLNKPPA